VIAVFDLEAAKEVLNNGCIYAILLEGVVEKKKIQSILKNRLGSNKFMRKEALNAKLCNLGEV
jgi:hypothetical protein